ncbi:MAG: histidine kinase [Verrucomicrobia bacterium]|nr:MAG: histidine kinase [Verrucomicrobiota bacterium]
MPSKSSSQSSERKQQDSRLPMLSIDEKEADDCQHQRKTASNTVRVVGIGGSAGGLTALQAFFSAIPPDSGLAFVVILHLAPDHASNLAAILQQESVIPVQQVKNGTQIGANNVYVIPPAKHLTLNGDYLLLTEMQKSREKPIAIDFFFQILGETYGPNAAAIVLSGAGSDGAIGLKRVKECGGLSIVQEPNEAEYSEMPSAAIATNFVDWISPVAEMPGKLIKYWEKENSSAETAIEPTLNFATPEQSRLSKSKAVETMFRILGLLRVRTGHDFTYYKRATVLRRIIRRLQINGLQTLESYYDFIRTHPNEPAALLSNLLISVTNFYRDCEAFKALEEALPFPFHGKGPGDSVRVWVAACATGEEAYSVAILLHEYAHQLEHPPSIQIFATDLAERAIQVARKGIYPETIAREIGEERFRRFFSAVPNGYAVKREIRETMLFAVHDLLKDAPFSRLDMITCRNLLIYFNRDAQISAAEIFHFALRPDGILFLGLSESLDESNNMFSAVDKKHRIYRRRPGLHRIPTMLSEAGAVTHGLPGSISPPLPPQEAPPAQHAPPPPPLSTNSLPPSWHTLHYEFLEELAPPSVLITEDYNVVHTSKNAGQYLKFPGGTVSTNLLNLVSQNLRPELRMALSRAHETQATVEVCDIPLEASSNNRRIDFRIVPAHSNDRSLLLVIFREKEISAALPAPKEFSTETAEPVILQLERELAFTRAQLRNVVEEADASNEELKAANEELQAMNEELRSTGEELDMSREELQSINEELNTLNQELKSKVSDLSQSNSDLQNLMAAIQIPTIFLDRRLCIQRYTPSAVALFNLIPSDVGRPLSDLAPRLSYFNFSQDARRVLDEFITIETEVAHTDERHFLTRILPYRTTDDHIAGVVMTFVDITGRRKAEQKLEESEARFRTVSNVVPDLLYSTDVDGKLLWCNQRWLSYTGKTPQQLQGYGWMDAIYDDDRETARRGFEAALKKGQPYHSEYRLVGADGEPRWFLIRAQPLVDEAGNPEQWIGAKTDINDFKRTTAELAASKERLRLLIESAHEFAIFSMDLELNITFWNAGAQKLLGYTEREILNQKSEIMFTSEDRAAGIPKQETQKVLRGQAVASHWYQRKDGSCFWASGSMLPINDANGKITGFVKILRDETRERKAKEELVRSREKLVAVLKKTEHAREEAIASGHSKDRFLAILSHELRTPLTPALLTLQMLSRDPHLSDSTRKHLLTIQRNLEIEAQMIDDLLDINHVSQGKLEIQRHPIDLHETLKAALTISTNDIQKKKQKLVVKLDAKQHSIIGDGRRLQQAFWNILKNASKFTPKNGAISVLSWNSPGKIHIKFSDSGIGFPPEFTERIFDAFAQADETITREFGGLGLGLAISKATIDAHGGSLRAESDGPGKGATFIITLTLKPFKKTEPSTQ